LKNPASHKDFITMQHGLSQSLLAIGEYDQGWELYMTRLDPDYGHATTFLLDMPRWDGLDLSQIKGKTLLWVGEQGLGDEILFLQMGRDLLEAVGPDGELRIAVEKRLVDMVQAALPQAKVGSHRTVRREGKDLRLVIGFENAPAADLWTPFAQPARALRRSLDQFPSEPILNPDPADIARWRSALDALGDGLKVGILWKSLKMDAKRTKHFSAFDKWKPILKTPGVDFVSLQYGQAQDDIDFAQSKFGVTVHQLDGIDLKDDLEQVTALTRACDLLIGPSNATTNLAGAAGAPTWLLQPYKNIWSHMGTGQSPWYPSSHSYFCEGNSEWVPVMRAVATDLAELAQKRQSA